MLFVLTNRPTSWPCDIANPNIRLAGTISSPNAYTELHGISNYGVILGNPQGGPFLYKNGTFKRIYYATPDDVVARGVSANGMITAEVQVNDGTYGFTAVCQ